MDAEKVSERSDGNPGACKSTLAATQHLSDPGRSPTTPRRFSVAAAWALVGLLLSACHSIGPRTVPQDRVDYAKALSDSWKDQMVLNIVRLRYGDAPAFLDVSSVISAYTLQGGVEASGTFNAGSANGSSFVGAGGGYNDRPTISYTPLSGAKFAKSLLEPIPPGAIFSLIAAGYPADIVIPITVNSLNGVYNRSSHGGQLRPSDPEFYPLVDAMQRIQASHSFSLRIEKRNDEQVAIATFASRLGVDEQRDIAFVHKTLNLRSENGEVNLSYGAVQRSPNELAVQSRSMIQIMGELSAGMAVPAEDVSDGRTYATPAPPAVASPYDQPRVRIHSGATPPDDAFTSVQYRGAWYWISDHDIGSKRALTFLLLFFSLAETGVAPEAPLLTIPVQ